MEQKKYMDIERLKPTFSDGFEKGDYIIVQEKIDGANFSIRYDAEDNTVKAFSRKKPLDFSNNLRGAWNWSQTLDIELVKSVLGSNLVLFMEWLVPHTIRYPNDKYNHAYCYDIYDTESRKYLPQDTVEEKVKALGLTYVPVFYKGEFTSWDDLKALVGKTEMGCEYGEGIVVKNQTKLNNPNTRLPFYTKIVHEHFCETKAHRDSKPVDMDKVAERERLQSLTETIVTEARVRKLIHKMVDENIIPENWDEHNMKTIAKNIGTAVYYDCVKEEPDTVEQVGSTFGKLASSTAMRIVKSILIEKNSVL